MDKAKLRRFEDLARAMVQPAEKLPVIIVVNDEEENARTRSLIYSDGSEELITEAQCEEICQKGQAQQVISVVSSRSKEMLKDVLAGKRTER